MIGMYALSEVHAQGIYGEDYPHVSVRRVGGPILFTMSFPPGEFMDWHPVSRHPILVERYEDIELIEVGCRAWFKLAPLEDLKPPT